VKSEKERSDQCRPTLFEEGIADEEQQDRVHRVKRDVEQMKSATQGPVEHVARLQQRAHTAALDQRSPGMHRRIVDDDVVIVEVEHPGERG